MIDCPEKSQLTRTFWESVDDGQDALSKALDQFLRHIKTCKLCQIKEDLITEAWHTIEDSEGEYKAGIEVNEHIKTCKLCGGKT